MGKDKGLEEAGERKDKGGHLIEVEVMSGGARYPLEDAATAGEGGSMGAESACRTLWSAFRFRRVKPVLRSCGRCFAPWHES